ncbi:DUF4124 domain-containing protein [Massilia sp. CCM 8733]|uniref:DUF4124 domain-containing protein n=1 Tax=Massilia mucilaginosa TaxID=2609282 RepID=A0ABX0P1X0_9BURK|nr:DUF4124 domain-containing protein [Massilia mucilaginosa]NHZ92944.1 DUF4124 domain-containing protein [Massilia mucilaginosa]
MNKLQPIFVIAATLICCAASAQQLYKTVGPDGKVTFSDRPQNGEKLKVSVMKGSVLRPVEGPVPPVPKIGPPSKGTGAHGAGNGISAAGVPSPELQHAVLVVSLMSEVAAKFEPVCSRAAPQNKKFVTAANGWTQRNSSFIEKQRRALADMAPSRRTALQGEVAAKIHEAMTDVLAQGAAGQVRWCEKATIDMSGGANDVVNNAEVAMPLITYKPK